MGLEKIKHIVVLVMENRSFDHMLGYLGLEDDPKVDGLQNAGTNTLNGVTYWPTPLQSGRFSPGPNHHFDEVARQLGPNVDMSGFVEDYAKKDFVSKPGLVMGYHDATQLPVYDFLARNYAVCDRWFAALPGPTLPNRAFLLAGHSWGVVENNAEMLARFLEQPPLETIFDRLDKAPLLTRPTWNVYYHDVPLLMLMHPRLENLSHVRRFSRFLDDAAKGDLPNVSWIDPNFTVQGSFYIKDGANDDHPPADVASGQALVRDIYEALRTSPQWEETLFIITYDEHGGFYDHVAPPDRPERAPFGSESYRRLGVRVPAFLISPWIEAGSVIHDELEHTSIAKTILEKFFPDDPNLPLSKRVETAPSLGTYLTHECRKDRPEAPLVTTDPTGPAVGGFSESPAELDHTHVSELTEMLGPLAGIPFEADPPRIFSAVVALLRRGAARAAS